MLFWISVIESPDDIPVEDVEVDKEEEFDEELESDVALVWKYYNNFSPRNGDKDFFKTSSSK